MARRTSSACGFPVRAARSARPATRSSTCTKTSQRRVRS